MSDVPDYFFVQSAVIPYRKHHGDIEILLITSRKKRRWVIPKGVKEPELSPTDSAAQEALEEAGIEGQVSEYPIGHYEYDKWGGTCRVVVFTMKVEKVHAEWLESYRDREWVSIEQAASRVNEKQLKKMLRSMPDFLEKRSNHSGSPSA
ncbi:MAG: NUDIX hydrolase [Arenicellales bacterium]|nr:NUDIX hydrolase [Arenicellales bacterium]